MTATVFKRNGGNFYARLFIDSAEVWISLRTKDHAVAILRRTILDGLIASATLARKQREAFHKAKGTSMLTREDMWKIVRRFVREELEQGEEDRASRIRITENDREAISLGLSDAFDTTLDHLQTNNLAPIGPTVDTLLATHGLSLAKDSTEYRVFSRLVLKGRMEMLKVEAERWDGDEEESTAPVGDSCASSASEPLKAAALTKPLSEVITAYFKEHKREP